MQGEPARRGGATGLLGRKVLWLEARRLELELVAMAMEAVGVLALLIVYNLKSSLFSSALPNLLGKLNFLDYFDNFAFNNIFDVSGVVFYVSVSMFFIFLTSQVLQKRRWS